MAKVNLDKPISKKEGGVLAHLWRKIIKDNNYSLPILYNLIDKYVAKTDRMKSRVKNVKRKARSTLEMNISDGDMTIKTFFDLIFNLLNVKKVDITIKLTYPNGMETIHSTRVNNSNYDEETGEEDKDESGKSKTRTKKED